MNLNILPIVLPRELGAVAEVVKERSLIPFKDVARNVVWNYKIFFTLIFDIF